MQNSKFDAMTPTQIGIAKSINAAILDKINAQDAMKQLEHQSKNTQFAFKLKNCVTR